MKRSPVIHPFLFALYPVMAVLAASLQLLDPLQAIRPTIVVLLITTFILVLLHWVYKNWYRAGFITSITIFMLFYYGYSYRLPREIHLFNFSISRHVVIICFWIVFLGIVSSKWLWQRVRPHVINNFLNITSGLAFVYGLYLLLSVWMAINQDPLVNWSRPENPLEDNTRLATTYNPDIYYIILDGYARADVLEEIYNYDNSSFINSLLKRGFYVATDSHSNYTFTQLSLASSLNFEYLDYLTFTENISSSKKPLGQLILNNRVSEWLKQAGYHIYLSSEYLFSEISDPNVVFYDNKPLTLNTVEGLLLESTMFEILVDSYGVNISNYTYQTHREKILNSFAETKDLVYKSSPKFIFVHVIAPHGPFVFDEVGNPVQPDWEYMLFDGSDLYGELSLYKEAYTKQLKYISTLIMETIDYVLQNSSTQPIIILQADHGPAAYLGTSVETCCFYERFSILNAYFFPDGNISGLYPSISPVNTFRLIFNKYFDSHISLLPDLSYYSPYEDPYQYTNVTTDVGIPCSILQDP